jgi:hypothetical protein
MEELPGLYRFGDILSRQSANGMDDHFVPHLMMLLQEFFHPARFMVKADPAF